LHFHARLIPGGRNISTVEVVVDDRDGQHCVTATGTMASRSYSADRRPEGDAPGT
jgi:GTP-dependent phosphoenolpyruvate carboxykinase